MSRSFKHQPFQAICGNGSAKQDKRMAHQGERRMHKVSLRKALLEGLIDDYLPPHKLECPWNEVYSWGRDGNQMYCGIEYLGEKWYQRMMRK